MTNRLPSRRERGIAQNFANQLAQLAAGWQLIVDAPTLRQEPKAGVMEFDAVEGSATLNGKPAVITMASILNDWVLAELGRKKLPASWLLSARVSVRYSGIARDKSGELAHLTATAIIGTSYGNFSASFENAQLIFHQRSGIGKDS